MFATTNKLSAYLPALLLAACASNQPDALGTSTGQKPPGVTSQNPDAGDAQSDKTKDDNAPNDAAPNDAAPNDSDDDAPSEDPDLAALKSDTGYFAIDGANDSDIWAVGDSVAHYDGTTWQLNQPPVDADWLHVAVASDGRVWVTEGYERGAWSLGNTLLYHWTGSAWVAWPYQDLPPDAQGRSPSSAYQPISLNVDGAERLWLGLEFAPEELGMSEPFRPHLFWESGEWSYVASHPPSLVADDGVAYAHNAVFLQNIDPGIDLANCAEVDPMSFAAKPGVALVTGGVYTRVVALLSTQGGIPTGQLAICDIVLSEDGSTAYGTSQILDESIVGRLALAGPDIEKDSRGQPLPRVGLVALGGEHYLLGADNFRRTAIGEDWQPLDWDFPARDGWGSAPASGWFVGPSGIARWDGETLTVSEVH